MKLIIDIPEDVYTECQGLNVVKSGTPLDDVKDMIRDKKVAETDIAREYYNLGLGDAINILDYVGKAESEE